MHLAKKTGSSFIYAVCMHALTSIKLCFIVGSKAAFFSLNQCFAPIIGFFAGTKESGLIFLARTIIGFYTMGFGVFTLLYHLPTLFGTLYLTCNSRIFRVALPLLCVFLFTVHPIGAQSFPYVMYWIPPIILGFALPRSIFLQALASTLTTHAVGSVFWLYSHETNPGFWYSLIPIVWIERLIFALCMTAAYYGICFLRDTLSLRTQARSHTLSGSKS